MFVLGLTGSIAMGKTTVAAMFARCGALVHDADATVHRLYAAGGAAVEAVAALVPAAVAAGRVDRAVLARAVLADAALLRALEAAVHPLVLAERERFLRHARRRRARLAVLEVPLLFESGGARLVDASARAARHGALIDARLLAEVYIELEIERRGGRQAGLAFAAAPQQDGHPAHPSAAPRAPRPHAASAEEIRRHAAFLDRHVENAIWRRYRD